MRNLSTETKRLVTFLVGLFMILVFVVVIVVTQTPPTITKTAEVTMAINPSPDFSLETSVTHIETFPNRVVSFAVSVTSVNNFAGDITFSVSGLPSEITVTYFPSDTLTLGPAETKGIQIDLGIPLNQALVGDYTIVVTATSTNYN